MDALQVIARIHTELPEKFGVPRQSGLVPQLRGRIVFEPAYRNPDAVRGLEDFSHLWLIWQFSGAIRQDWSPTVRPPRLGGNRRMGVFATRSPFRPNHLGLSSVRLERVEQSEALGPVLHVCGADLMDGTPIFDIKPYLPYTDSHPDAVGASPMGWRAAACGWSVRRSCWSASRRTAGRACWVCWRGIPAPGIRRIPSGCTAWALRGRTCDSPWRGIPSRCAPSTRWRSNANIKSTRTPMKTVTIYTDGIKTAMRFYR